MILSQRKIGVNYGRRSDVSGSLDGIKDNQEYGRKNTKKALKTE